MYKFRNVCENVARYHTMMVHLLGMVLSLILDRRKCEHNPQADCDPCLEGLVCLPSGCAAILNTSVIQR